MFSSDDAVHVSPNSALEEGAEDWLSIPVCEKHDGARIDSLIAQSLPAVGRRLAARLCDEGSVVVDGRAQKKGTPVRAGQVVEVLVRDFGRAVASPDIPLRVVLERSDVVIVDKEAGIPTSAIVGSERGTLAGALLARYPEMSHVGYGPREPGILHRLDHFTSGLVVAARTETTFRTLRAALMEGKWKKKYLALVQPGRLADHGFVDAALAPDPKSRKKVIVTAEAKRTFRTSFTVLERHRECDLVELSVSAAYRHQIRVHMAHAGAPLLGDDLYGGQPTTLSPRHALHASYIACNVADAEPFEVEIPLPEDLSALRFS